MTWNSWVAGGVCVLAVVFLVKTIHDFLKAERRLAELQRQHAAEKEAQAQAMVADTRRRQISPFVQPDFTFSTSQDPLDFPFITEVTPAPTTPKQRVLLSDLLKNLEKATPDRANKFTPPTGSGARVIVDRRWPKEN